MAAKYVTLSIAFALLAGCVLSLPVSREEETDTSALDDVSLPDPHEESAFNYEVPAEVNPDDLDEEQKQLTELRPPAIDSYVPFRVEEPSTDAAVPEKKPRKGSKKYNKEEKWINKKTKSTDEEQELTEAEREEREYAAIDFIIDTIMQGLAARYHEENAGGEDLVLDLNKGEYVPSLQRRIESSADALLHALNEQGEAKQE